MAAMCKQFGCHPYALGVIKALDKRRVERGLSQKDFSDIVGYPDTMWGNLCRGTAAPLKARLCDFAAFFDLTIWSLPIGLVLHRDGVKK